MSAGAGRSAPAETNKNGTANNTSSPRSASASVETNVEHSLEFLRTWELEGAWVLTAIPCDGGAPTAATFSSTSEAECREWVSRLNSDRKPHNIYFQPAELSHALHGHRQAKKSDVRTVEWLWVDIDPDVPDDLRLEQARMLLQEKQTEIRDLIMGDEFPAGIPQPTVVVFSGGGYQAFWKLAEPVHIGGDENNARQVESRNLELGRRFGGDSVQNADRIMRLPGTINWPKQKKVKRGQEPALARVIEFHSDRVYQLEEFKPASLDIVPFSGARCGVRVLTAPAPSLGDVHELDEWGVPDWCKVLVTFGKNPDAPDKYPSRSEALFAVVCELVRRGVPNRVILSVVLDPVFKISESVLEKGAGAEKYAAKQIESARDKVPATGTGDDGTLVLPPGFVPFSEDHLAHAFVCAHADTLRYCARWRTWFYWLGTHWTRDNTLLIRDRVRILCHQAAQHAEKNMPLKITTAASIAAVERLAQSDPRVACTDDVFDADPDGLNTPDGIVCLKTGHIFPPDPSSYCTKVTRVGPAPEGARPHLWLRVLDDVTNGDQAFIDYLQSVCGYMLTGDTREHALFFAWGTGQNGKSVFVNTLRYVLGDYATSTPMDTLTASNHERHPTDLADLRGARVVTAQETEQGQRWAESKIKQMTGGDPIKARFMRQDFFEYVPQFKLIIAGNHRPSLNAVDVAMKRRIHLLPFTVTIPEVKVDRHLEIKLRAEAPEILRWMIDGCLAWRRNGLERPDVVLIATGDYLESEDTLGLWLAECATKSPDAQARAGELYGSWQGWCNRNGEPCRSKKWLTQQLLDRGFESARAGKGVRVIRGLTLRESIDAKDGAQEGLPQDDDTPF